MPNIIKTHCFKDLYMHRVLLTNRSNTCLYRESRWKTWINHFDIDFKTNNMAHFIKCCFPQNFKYLSCTHYLGKRMLHFEIKLYETWWNMTQLNMQNLIKPQANYTLNHHHHLIVLSSLHFLYTYPTSLFSPNYCLSFQLHSPCLLSTVMISLPFPSFLPFYSPRSFSIINTGNKIISVKY